MINLNYPYCVHQLVFNRVSLLCGAEQVRVNPDSKAAGRTATGTMITTHTHTRTHAHTADLMFEPCNCTWCCSSSPPWIEGGHKQHQVKQNARLNLGQVFPTGAYCEWYHSTKYRQQSTVHCLFLQYVRYTVLVRSAKQQCCSIKYNCKFAKYSHGHLEFTIFLVG